MVISILAVARYCSLIAGGYKADDKPIERLGWNCEIALADSTLSEILAFMAYLYSVDVFWLRTFLR